MNGEELFAEDVASVLSEIHGSMSPRQRSDFDLDRMLFRLVNDTLLAQEARVLEMHKEPAIQRSLANRREQLARQRLEQEEIRNRVQIDEEDLERVYREVYRTASLRLVTRKDRAEAEALRPEVETTDDLEELARTRSQDPYSARGGLMQSAPWIDIPVAIRDLAVDMQPGEVAGPVPISVGWTVFRVEELAPADPELFESRKGKVRSLVRISQQEELRSILLGKLRSNHAVEIDQAVFDSIEIKRMIDGRLLPEIDKASAVVVDAGGRPITAAVFGQALAARWANIANPDVAIAIKPILLETLIVDELMTVEALQRGYDNTPEVDHAIHAMETRLLVKRYLSDVVLPQVEVTEDQLRTYYSENRDEFRRPPRLFVSQLTVTSREEAERLAEMVRSGTEFAWLARQHSIDRYSETGGSVGWVKANEGIKGFHKELANASSGDLLGPKGADDEWRLVLVGALEEQEHYRFEEVSGNVRTRLEDRTFLELVDTYIRRLREDADIWINQEAIVSLQFGASPSSGETKSTAPGHGGGQ